MYEDPNSVGTGGNGAGSSGVVGALAMAAASAYDSYNTSKTAKRNTDKSIAANRAEAELAYQRSQQMWEQQNAYNSPAAQMARFKQAGLSPHLVYGQGNAGNATSVPAYHPPSIQYAYEAPRFGQAAAGILPMLMQIGSWMQDMRLKQAQIRSTEVGIEKSGVDIERLRQLVSYLEGANPKQLKLLENKLDVFPYQRSAIASGADLAWRKVADFSQEFEHKHGYTLFDDSGLFGNMEFKGTRGDSLRKEQLLQAIEKSAQARSETKLKEAQASWADFDITNPQQIMMMVLNGVMGLAGQTLRLGKGGKGSAPVKQRPQGVRKKEMSPARRVQMEQNKFYEKVWNRPGWQKADHRNFKD